MKIIYRLAQIISYQYFKIFHRIEISGLENIPAQGSFILACNHASFFDPPAIGCKIPRNLHYFARSSLFRGPLGFLIKNLNSIPVNRDQLDLGTLRTILRILKNGDPILVFPEGTRSQKGKLQEAQKGLGLLVVKSGASVIPARISGTNEVLGKGMMFPRLGRKVELRLGEEIHKNQLIDTDVIKERYQNISDKVMSEISLL